jgi:hypothetical protein
MPLTRPLAERETDYAARVALALSILGHRQICANCAHHTEQVKLALQGATIDEIRELGEEPR